MPSHLPKGNPRLWQLTTPGVAVYGGLGLHCKKSMTLRDRFGGMSQSIKFNTEHLLTSLPWRYHQLENFRRPHGRLPRSDSYCP